jgi:antitoxin component HigA of HigAB toxin-antitoxin module
MENNKFNYISATDARKDWSQLFDSVVREKPQFIKRTRDHVLMADLNLLSDILTVYTFTAERHIEDDGSVTLSLNELDIIENGLSEDQAKDKVAHEILEYAMDYYEEFHYWSSMPNRKKHIPYIMKALILQDASKIKELIQCQNGRS